MTRKEQKEFLKSIYPDYDPKNHDAFVYRYQKEEDKNAEKRYMINRGIIEKGVEL